MNQMLIISFICLALKIYCSSELIVNDIKSYDDLLSKLIHNFDNNELKIVINLALLEKALKIDPQNMLIKQEEKALKRHFAEQLRIKATQEGSIEEKLAILDKAINIDPQND